MSPMLLLVIKHIYFLTFKTQYLSHCKSHDTEKNLEHATRTTYLLVK